MNKGQTLHSLQKRILVLVVLISFIFIALFVRLFFVQVVKSEYLQSLAEDQWTRALPIIAQRGEILDTNNSQLAVSYATYNVYTRAREITSPGQVSSFLSETLGVKYSTVYQKVTNRSASEILISAQVDSETAIKIHKKQFDGVYIAENSKRHYPYGDLLTQVLGFVTSDNQGQAGIELYYEDELKGQNGYSLIQSDLTGVSLENTLDYYTAPISGNSITLTIDANLQLIVERVLAQIMVEQKAKGVSCIIMKSKTGEILSMASKPSFDLNNVPRDNVSELMSTVKNKSVVDVYEPGSTFKIITMAIALETGVAKLSDTFYCSGSCVVDGEKIKCWKSIGHGSQTLAEGLANSCNCVFTTLAQRIGLETFYKYLELFGYGTPTGINISGESGGILMNKSDVKVVDLARMGFGQAVAVTLLQQIAGISAATNGGMLCKPYLVSKIADADGNILEETTPSTVRQVISAETSKIINDMLNLTVSKQTGEYSFVPGYAVGGKTGTTQKYVDGVIKDSYISSFAGTYPVNNPEYTIIISVDEPGAGAYYGSIVASPYAKTIFSEMFKLYNIKPDDPKLAEKEVKSYEMPALVGFSLTKAVETMKKMGISYEIAGSGGTVKNQIPLAGVKVYETDTILIET